MTWNRAKSEKSMTCRLRGVPQPNWSQWQLARYEQVVVLAMLLQVRRGVRAARLHLQFLCARKLKSCPRHTRSEAAVLKRLRHFGVIDHHLARRPAVIEPAEFIAKAQFEPLFRLIVND